MAFDLNKYFTSKGGNIKKDTASIREAADALLAAPKGLTNNSAYEGWAQTALSLLNDYEAGNQYDNQGGKDVSKLDLAYEWLTGAKQSSRAKNVFGTYGEYAKETLAKLQNEEANIANIQADGKTKAPADRLSAYQQSLTDYNKNYGSIFGEYKSNLTTLPNGYIVQTDANGKPASAAVGGQPLNGNVSTATPRTPDQQAAIDRQLAIEAEAMNKPVDSVTAKFQATSYSDTSKMTDLQKTVMGANPASNANKDFINGAFKAFHGRDATAQELAKFEGKQVGQVRNDILAGAQSAKLPTVTAGTTLFTPSEATKMGLTKILNPGQLSAFTEDQIVRDNAGNIYLRDGAATTEQMEAVKAGKTAQEIIGVRTPSPSSSADAALVERGINSPSASSVFREISNNANPAEVIDTVASATTDILSRSIAALDVQLADITKSIEASQSNINTISGRIANMAFNQTSEASLQRVTEEQGIKEKREALSEIMSQIAAEKQKLNLGLIQEKNKLAPMSILNTRQNALIEQANGTIGALAAVAQILQDDLDFAKEMVNTTMTAINNDRTTQLGALELFLSLEQDNIVDLKEDERAVIEARKDILVEAMSNAQKDAESVFDLIKDNPMAAVSGGVSLTDSPALALSKMAPYMAQEEARAAKKDNFVDVKREDGSMVRVFTDENGMPTKEVPLVGADPNADTGDTERFDEFTTDLASLIGDMNTFDSDGNADISWQGARDQLSAKYQEVPQNVIDSQLAGGVTIWQSKDYKDLNEFLKDYPSLKPESDFWKSQGKKDQDIIRDFESKYKPSFNDVGADTNTGARLSMSRDIAIPNEMAQLKTLFGVGTVTGYGSKYWTPGLDFVLPGGENADVKLPVPVKVLAVEPASKTGGFGNRVRLSMPDGKILWVSHLEKFANIRPGQSLAANTVIGKQGNTGNVYGKTGIHMDLTMPKPGGGYYSAQDVARYLKVA